MPGVTGGGVAPVRGGAWWPERDTVPAENCAFVPPMTKRRAMVRRSGRSGKGKVERGSGPREKLKAEGGELGTMGPRNGGGKLKC